MDVQSKEHFSFLMSIGKLLLWVCCVNILSFSIISSNYQHVQNLSSFGNEIAVESISLQQGLQDKGFEEWAGEMVGMREILRQFAYIPNADVNGMRAPVNITFKVFWNSHMKYFLFSLLNQEEILNIK